MKNPSEMNADETEMNNRIVHLESVIAQIYDDLSSARDITEDYEHEPRQRRTGHAVVVLLHDAEELAKEALEK